MAWGSTGKVLLPQSSHCCQLEQGCRSRYLSSFIEKEAGGVGSGESADAGVRFRDVCSPLLANSIFRIWVFSPPSSALEKANNSRATGKTPFPIQFPTVFFPDLYLFLLSHVAYCWFQALSVIMLLEFCLSLCHMFMTMSACLCDEGLFFWNNNLLPLTPGVAR